MAKKTVFEGVVNGIKFDNVKEYNEYLMKLIEVGEPVNASTSTHTENECECCGCCECETECCDYECNEPKSATMLPGAIHKGNKDYVDLYTTDNGVVDKQSRAALKEELTENLDGIIKKVSRMDEAALEGYLKDVNEITSIINEDMELTIKARSIREREIREHYKDLEKLKRALLVLNIWKDNYESIKRCIEDAQTKYQSGSCTPTKEDIDDKIAKELEDRLVGAMTKLANILGINPKDFKNIKIGY